MTSKSIVFSLKPIQVRIQYWHCQVLNNNHNVIVPHSVTPLLNCLLVINIIYWECRPVNGQKAQHALFWVNGQIYFLWKLLEILCYLLVVRLEHLKHNKHRENPFRSLLAPFTMLIIRFSSLSRLLTPFSSQLIRWKHSCFINCQSHPWSVPYVHSHKNQSL